MPAKHQCKECGKTYNRVYELNHHIKQKHPEKQTIIHSKENNLPFKCSQCNKNFSYKKHLKYHLKSHGSTTESNINLNIPVCDSQKKREGKKCVFCDFVSSQSTDFHSHYKHIHDVTIEFETLEFSSAHEFTTWKDSLEKQTNSKYIKKRAPKSCATQEVTYYVCHRSGFFHSESKGKRHLKTQGSNKINGFCPAALKVAASKINQKIVVSHTRTHVGHQNELGHLFLTLSERQSIATKIAMKIPFDTILDEIRDCVSSTTELERMHLLTKKDLFNIEASFNLQSSAVRHSNDAISVEAWVNEVRDHCVLFYKPQGMRLQEYPQLKEEDFLLVIMNEGQLEMFKKFSSDCICIDGTHGLNSYQFELHTLMVLDHLRQGFPCAFCISNRSDEEIMSLFFECIKKQAGTVKAQVFMSDMAETYYNAWSKVMSEAHVRLFCTWHVDRAWRKNLHLITSKETQIAVYKSMRALLQETDHNAFDIMIKKFMENLFEDNETSAFGQYFKTYYFPKVRAWAYCYRLHAGLNTNMHVERMHKTIKYIYLKGKNVKRLDKAIHALMKLVRDKLFDRIIVLNKGKICSKLKQLRNSHQRSKELKTESISKVNDTWQILSTSKHSEMYTVYENVKHCGNCQLVCTDCEACIHQYFCSCLDSSIKWNMCKHIHLLCRHLKETRQNMEPLPEQENTTNNLEIVINEGTQEAEMIYEQLNKGDSSALDIRRQKVVETITSIAQNINTEEEMNVLEKMVAPIKPALSALQASNNTTSFKNDSNNNTPHNKNVIPQRRLLSTKKKREKKVDCLVKPTSAECANIAIKLMYSKNCDSN